MEKDYLDPTTMQYYLITISQTGNLLVRESISPSNWKTPGEKVLQQLAMSLSSLAVMLLATSPKKLPEIEQESTILRVTVTQEKYMK